LDKATVERMSSNGKHRKGYWQAGIVAALVTGIAVGASSTTAAFVMAEESPTPVSPPVSLPAPQVSNAAERILLTESASRAADRQVARLERLARQAKLERREASLERQAAREAQSEPVPEPLEPVVSYPVSGNRAIGQEMMLDRWGMDQWPCLDELWSRESSWNHLAENPSSGAYGIPQSLPGSKMATAGDDWATNPATQIEWGLTYIGGRYGSPCEALWFHDSMGWY